MIVGDLYADDDIENDNFHYEQNIIFWLMVLVISNAQYAKEPRDPRDS